MSINRKKMQNKYKRKSKFRNPKPNILIICQGEKTEPNYFKGMKLFERISNVNIEIISTPVDPYKIIECSLIKKRSKEYDQIWCVFDIDATTIENVNRAFTLADRNKIRIAYSNEAFELWYILHFEYLNITTDRKAYIGKLNRYLKNGYKKNDNNMYEILSSNQKLAISNSKKLFNKYSKFDPYNNNPSTTVHKIVEKLKEP